MGRWIDLEASLVAQVRTEPAFATVQSAALPGVVNITTCPAVTIAVLGGKVVGQNFVASKAYVAVRVMIEALISTRRADVIGESRLQTGGVWDLFDKLTNVLLGFLPVISNPLVLSVQPVLLEDHYLDRLEPGAVDLFTLWHCDITIQNP